MSRRRRRLRARDAAGLTAAAALLGGSMVAVVAIVTATGITMQALRMAFGLSEVRNRKKRGEA